ncbi:hypothetical protein DERF_005860 [Dermatophagoides farinae]|uniref:Chitin-binding type-2 domain-containing protein n=2 Tax=Dermatophagoides farinae TaxID=6954 RepID=A0A922IAD3_DERFA|nr:hypothetical protein DERF_005860 [Dermatophagoides farinae]
MIESSISRRRTQRISRTGLPDGARIITMGKDFNSTFKCEKDKDGFFADVEYQCRIFHRCHTAHNAGNRIQVLHYSFFCSDRLVFDQSTHTCRRRADAIPCETSPMFFDLNDRIGSDGPFLTHADIDRAKAVRPEYRRRRRRR